MRPASYLLAVICMMAATSTATYVLTDPVGKGSLAQKAILMEYVDVYCRSTPHLQPFVNDQKAAKAAMVGEMALLSRLTVESSLGSIALAEWAKCKAEDS